MKKQQFATEAEMCSAFLSAIGPDWTAYNGTAGWDILLVRKADGFQIGIEAKLKLNAIVLSQAIEGSIESSGPDCRAVLVPGNTDGALNAVADYCGLTVIKMCPGDQYRKPWFYPMLPSTKDHMLWREEWHETCPLKRCRLPEYVPDVNAGEPAPLQLTPWKISAMKIASLLELTGYVTRADFKALKIDHRRWIAPGASWLKPVPDGRTDDIGIPRFEAGGSLPDFSKQHPDVFAQIKADAPKWMPGVRPDAEAPAKAKAADLFTGDAA